MAEYHRQDSTDNSIETLIPFRRSSLRLCDITCIASNPEAVSSNPSSPNLVVAYLYFRLKNHFLVDILKHQFKDYFGSLHDNIKWF